MSRHHHHPRHHGAALFIIFASFAIAILLLAHAGLFSQDLAPSSGNNIPHIQQLENQINNPTQGN